MLPAGSTIEWVATLTTPAMRTVTIGARANTGNSSDRRTIMKKATKYVAPWLAAVAMSAGVVLAPAAFATPVPGPLAQAPAAPAPTPAPGPSDAGASPLVPDNQTLPDVPPYDPYLKNPAGGVDLPS
jgi:hypothetical protein